MAILLLGIVLIIWSLTLLGVLAISNTILGVLLLITGILLIAGNWVDLPAIRR
jgi:uncharacterized membrane protein HdeD (DUF308 family)